MTVGPRSFAIDILLPLMLDEERGTLRSAARLPYGCAAALLADLAQLGRVTVTATAVTVIDARRTGHALLDEHLSQVRAGGERSPAEWIAGWAQPSLVERAIERLMVQGVLAVRSDRSFGPVRARRFRVIPPGLCATLRRHVRGTVVTGVQAVPAELALVAAILSVLGEDRLWGTRGHRDATTRARVLARTDIVAMALERALARRGRPDDLRAAAVHAAM